jgi:hypothetical protein
VADNDVVECIVLRVDYLHGKNLRSMIERKWSLSTISVLGVYCLLLRYVSFGEFGTQVLSWLWFVL